MFRNLNEQRLRLKANELISLRLVLAICLVFGGKDTQILNIAVVM
jgi:hypothetical protein